MSTTEIPQVELSNLIFGYSLPPTGSCIVGK